MKLQIPEPCPQKWEEMTSVNETTKFCSNCSKSIIDFSVQSDRQIKKAIYKSSGQLCGKFSSDQLNRSLDNVDNYFPNLRAIVLSGLLLNVTANLNGQVEMKAPQEQSISTSDPSYVVIKGRIKDTISPQLSGDLRVELNGFHLYCLPNSSGDFQFQVPRKSVPELISLTVRKGNAYKVYSDLNPNEFIDISVSLHPIYLDEDFINALPMIGVVVVKPKWYQFGYKFRRLWNRIIH
jgi:hypothetical protein